MPSGAARYEGKRACRKKIDVFGNTLVGIVCRALGKHFKAVVHLLSGPFGKIVFRHPFPPAERQALLQVVAVYRKGDMGEGKSRETEQPAVDRVAVIILQSAVKRIEPFV